jgi:hypothetical protein
VQRDNEIGNDNVMSHIDHEVRSLQNSIDDLYRQQ